MAEMIKNSPSVVRQCQSSFKCINDQQFRWPEAMSWIRLNRTSEGIINVWKESSESDRTRIKLVRPPYVHFCPPPAAHMFIHAFIDLPIIDQWFTWQPVLRQGLFWVEVEWRAPWMDRIEWPTADTYWSKSVALLLSINPFEVGHLCFVRFKSLLRFRP